MTNILRTSNSLARRNKNSMKRFSDLFGKAIYTRLLSIQHHLHMFNNDRFYYTELARGDRGGGNYGNEK